MHTHTRSDLCPFTADCYVKHIDSLEPDCKHGAIIRCVTVDPTDPDPPESAAETTPDLLVSEEQLAVHEAGRVS